MNIEKTKRDWKPSFIFFGFMTVFLISIGSYYAACFAAGAWYVDTLATTKIIFDAKKGK